MGTLGYLFARTIHVMRRKEFATYIQLNEEVKRRGEAEEQLRIHQDLLEEIVKERTDQLRKSEMNLLQAQRMESIGQLAGGIAHDFNNLLLVILGYSDLVAESDDIQEIRDYQKEVQSAAERGAEMAKQLLAFSRRQIMDITPVDIPALLTQLRNMIHPIVPANIDVEIRLPDEPIASMADYGQLEQALMNLVINARDAMPEGGSLQIGLSREALNDSFVDAHPWARAGEFAVIRVTDTGHGFSAETKTRIFEPFFTTKPEGQGTGLGLAMVFGTINQMNGFIHVYSEEGEGTEFKLYLPFLSEMIGKEKTESVEVGLTGSETILLVEDEPQVRALGSAVLRGAGYNVIEAEDGHEGMAVYGKHKDEIDLLFLDIVMPRMGGQDMMTALRENGDSIPILFTSGYSSSAIHTNFILQDGLELISKPYSPDLLKRKIREVLDRNAKLSS
jgi:signal transduction histidine kinase/ActR/RegA family two-component response regulator